MKILVVFVEPMLYGMDLIHEVYEKTPYEFQYIYCDNKLTGKDDLELPQNSFICKGNKEERRHQIIDCFRSFKPDFAVINGYVGIEQTVSIKYCQKHRIPYAIESDTPRHIPENKMKAAAKKIYLRKLLHNRYCYGFPGGTLQKENLVYYGIPEHKCFIMPMSVSEYRLLETKENIGSQEALKEKYSVTGKKVILFVGRLEVVKNVELLICSFETIKKENPHTALFIVGDGKERDRLEQLVAERNMEDVYFAGYVTFPKNIEYYKMADVFVLPSTYESWGLVINEAMIIGLPVVVSSHVGCREDLLKDGCNGFIFKDNDKISLVQSIRNALNLKMKLRMTDEWNYKKYLKEFVIAVEEICEK